MFLAACAPEKTQLIAPPIPNDLLAPVPAPARNARTLRDLGLLVVDYDEALSAANSKIEAIAEIVTRFKARITAPITPN